MIVVSESHYEANYCSAISSSAPYHQIFSDNFLSVFMFAVYYPSS